MLQSWMTFWVYWTSEQMRYLTNWNTMLLSENLGDVEWQHLTQRHLRTIQSGRWAKIGEEVYTCICNVYLPYTAYCNDTFSDHPQDDLICEDSSKELDLCTGSGRWMIVNCYYYWTVIVTELYFEVWLLVTLCLNSGLLIICSVVIVNYCSSTGSILIVY